MKRAVVALVIGLALAGCGSDTNEPEREEPAAEETTAALPADEICPEVQRALDLAYGEQGGVYEDTDHREFADLIESLEGEAGDELQPALGSLRSAAEASIGTRPGDETLAARGALRDAINLVASKCATAGSPLP